MREQINKVLLLQPITSPFLLGKGINFTSIYPYRHILAVLPLY